MEEDEDEEILDLIRDAAARQRPYAGFFQWPDRPVAELGIAQTFCEAAESEPGFPIHNLRSRPPGEDPPDCEGLDAKGRAIAIEVTELVDPSAIVSVRRTGRNDFAAWDTQKIRHQLDARLSAKEVKSLKGGPYHEYLILIHTDEPGLSPEQVSSALVGHSFPAMNHADRAYLLFSYDPRVSGYPYVRLL